MTGADGDVWQMRMLAHLPEQTPVIMQDNLVKSLRSKVDGLEGEHELLTQQMKTLKVSCGDILLLAAQSYLCSSETSLDPVSGEMHLPRCQCRPSFVIVDNRR